MDSLGSEPLVKGGGSIEGRWIFLVLVAEWLHFTLLGIISPTIKPKVQTFWVL